MGRISLPLLQECGLGKRMADVLLSTRYPLTDSTLQECVRNEDAAWYSTHAITLKS